jgi:hypothetical protein
VTPTLRERERKREREKRERERKRGKSDREKEREKERVRERERKRSNAFERKTFRLHLTKIALNGDKCEFFRSVASEVIEK